MTSSWPLPGPTPAAGHHYRGDHHGYGGTATPTPPTLPPGTTPPAGAPTTPTATATTATPRPPELPRTDSTHPMGGLVLIGLLAVALGAALLLLLLVGKLRSRPRPPRRF